MKIRIKFAKRGNLKFVGHLDMMRYFQKLIRRAGIDIAYSEGFNPHQKMSFAQPLGVGMLSEGEYVDIEVHTTFSTKEAIERLNKANAEGVEILSYRLLEDTAGNAMASVHAADYKVEFREGYKPEGLSFVDKFDEFFHGFPSILVTKETKKSQITLDIKPYIYEYGGDRDSLTLRLSCGSAVNIKPELVMDAFCICADIPRKDFMFQYTRLEVYGDNFIPLMDFGKDI